jgi:hypothetical protein
MGAQDWPAGAGDGFFAGVLRAHRRAGGRCAAAFLMSFLRHGEIYPFDEDAILHDRALPHRKDEFPAGYSWAGCTPDFCAWRFCSAGRRAFHRIGSNEAKAREHTRTGRGGGCARRVHTFPATGKNHPCAWAFRWVRGPRNSDKREARPQPGRPSICARRAQALSATRTVEPYADGFWEDVGPQNWLQTRSAVRSQAGRALSGFTWAIPRGRCRESG